MAKKKKTSKSTTKEITKSFYLPEFETTVKAADVEAAVKKASKK